MHWDTETLSGLSFKAWEISIFIWPAVFLPIIVNGCAPEIRPAWHKNIKVEMKILKIIKRKCSLKFRGENMSEWSKGIFEVKWTAWLLVCDISSLPYFVPLTCCFFKFSIDCKFICHYRCRALIRLDCRGPRYKNEQDEGNEQTIEKDTNVVRNSFK